jgi:multiple sugar transport system substrate-binding protein/sn-glycerol 3-phosphate transport system substrate-binding protein
MSRKTVSWVLLLAMTLSLLAGACTPATSEPSTFEAPGVVPTEAPEPVAPVVSAFDGIDPSGQTVTFWHPWGSGTTGETLTAIADSFNATNEWGITVVLVDQGRHGDVEDAMNVAVQSGDVPDLIVSYTNALSTWYSVGVMNDIDEYIYDPVYGLTDEEQADFYPGSWSGGLNSAGARVGFPIMQSANVLFYNDGWANDLGYATAPATWTEFKAQACAAAAANNADDNPDNDGTGGLVLNTGASNFASWVFAFDEDIVNDAADGYEFNTPVIQEVMGYIKELYDEGCAFVIDGYPNPEFASRQALFTTSSTAGLPYQVSAFEAEGATDDTWGFIPFPGDGTFAVDSFGQNAGIVTTTPEKGLAAWLFIKSFTSSEGMAEWISGSAYHPTRASTIALLGDYAASNPLWAEGLELLQYGAAEPQWASWGSVRRSIGDTFAAIIQGSLEDIPGLLAELDVTAAEALADTQ